MVMVLPESYARSDANRTPPGAYDRLHRSHRPHFSTAERACQFRFCIEKSAEDAAICSILRKK